METLNSPDALEFASVTEWETWLAANHDRSTGAWLRIGRKGAGANLISIDDAADVAFCYGWIDSQRKRLDASSYLQRYSPRRPTSSWSQVNVERVDALTAAGRMRDPGLEQVRLAKADGRWDAAYERQRDVTVPPDLEAALAADPGARAAFEALGKTDRYGLILQLLKARGDAARATRLRRVIEGLSPAGR